MAKRFEVRFDGKAVGEPGKGRAKPEAHGLIFRVRCILWDV